MMKIAQRFRRDAKFEDNPDTAFDQKPVDSEPKSDDLPSPPEKPSFCSKPLTPVVFGGGCWVLVGLIQYFFKFLEQKSLH